MAPPSPTENKSRGIPRSLKKLAWIVSIACTGIFVFIVLAITAFVLSPRLQRWALEKSKSSLRPFGIEWQADEQRIDILHEIGFKNLRLNLFYPLPATGIVIVDTFALNFDLSSILSKKLKVDSLKIVGADINLKLASEGPLEPAKESEVAKEPFDLVSFLKDPPAELEINGVTLQNIKADILVEDTRDPGKDSAKTMKAHLILESFALQSSATLKPGRLFMSWRQSLSTTCNVTTESQASDLSLRVQNTAESGGELSLALVDNEIEHTLRIDSVAVGLKNMQLSNTIRRPSPSKNEKPVQKHMLLTELLFDLGGTFRIPGNSDLKKLRVEEFKTNLKTQKLNLTSDGVTQMQVPLIQLSTSLKSDGVNPEGVLDLKVSNMNLKGSPQSRLNIHHLSKLSGSFENPELRIVSTSTLNKVGVAQSTVEIKNLNKNTTVGLKAQSSELIQLVKMLGLPKAVADLAISQVNVDQSLQLYNDKALWLSDFSDLGKIKIDQEISASISQDAKKTEKPVIRFKEITLSARTNLAASFVLSKLDLNISNAVIPALGQRSLNPKLKLELETGVASPLNGKVQILVSAMTQKPSMDETLLRIDTTFQDEAQLFKSLSKLSLHITEQWSDFALPLQAIRQVGGLDLSGELSVEMPHQSASLLDPEFAKDNNGVRLITRSDMSLSLKQPPSETRRLLVIPEAVRLSFNGDLDDKAFSSSLKVGVPEATLPGLGAVTGLDIESSLQIPDTSTLESVESKAAITAEGFKILADIPDRVEISKALGGLEFDLDLGVFDQKTIDIRKLELAVGGELLTLSGSGRIGLADAGEFRAETRLNLPGRLGPSTQATGRLSVPITASRFKDNRVSMSVQPQFSDVSLKLANFELRKLSGRISVSEELKINKNGSIDFIYLEKQSPFARVDFDNIEPLLSGSPTLTIESVRTGALELKTVITKIEVRQNMFLLNEISLEGLDGSVVGRAYGSFDPSNPQLGFLGRFSNLNPELLLAESQKSARSATGVLSGRGALEFDILKRFARGRVDVTSIGRDQLLRVLDVIDPQLRDPQINSARKALYIAAPEKIIVSMDQGLMDLQVETDNLAAKSISIRSIPLTPLILAHADDSLKILDSLFIHEVEDL